MSRLRQGSGARGSGRVISARALAIALVAIALFAAAPFVIANVVSERRVVTARAQASAIAAALQETATQADAAAILVGPGNMPAFDVDAGWPPAGRKGPPYDFEIPADPWRNAYVVNIGAPGTVWVVSAGPNGILETPFETGELQGDDIGSRVR